MKHAVALLIALSAMAVLSADPVFTVSSGDIAVRDYRGKALPLDETTARKASNGWIISTSDKPVTVSTPVGAIRLGADSTLITGSLNVTRPSLYLVSGSAQIVTEDSFNGTLTLTTPVTRYRTYGAASLGINTTEDMETVGLFKGRIQVLNGLTHEARVLDAPASLDLPTMATTPISDEEQEDWYRDFYEVPEEPSFTGVTVTPNWEVPGEPQTLDVYVDPMQPTFKVVRILPVAPAINAVSRENEEPEVPETLTVQAPAPAEPEPVAQAAPVEEPKPEKVKKPKKDTKNKVGLSLSYEFDWFDQKQAATGDVDPYDTLHTVAAVPFLDTPYFALGLKGYWQTHDGNDWDEDWSSNLTHFETDDWTYGVSSTTSYIDHFRIGSKDGHIFVAIDDEPIHEEGKLLTGWHAVTPTWKNLSLGMRFGSVRIGGVLDDVSLTNLKNDGWQQGNVSLSLVDNDKAFFSMGMVYSLTNKKQLYQATDDKASYMVSYPYLELDIPFVSSKKSTHFDLLGSVASYLPLAPDTDFDQIYDSDEEEFSNYFYMGGFSFGTDKLDILLTAGQHHGEVYPLLRGPFDRKSGTALPIEHKSDMDLRGQITYQGEKLSLGIMYNWPMDWDESDSIARTTNGRRADLLSIGGGLNLWGFSLEAGYEVYGIADTDNLADDELSAFIARIGYDVSDILHLEAGARKTTDTHSGLYGYALCRLTFSKGF